LKKIGSKKKEDGLLTEDFNPHFYKGTFLWPLLAKNLYQNSIITL